MIGADDLNFPGNFAQNAKFRNPAVRWATSRPAAGPPSQNRSDGGKIAGQGQPALTPQMLKEYQLH